MTKAEVAFVSMPFFPAFSCNYAVEYLAQICRHEGVEAVSLLPHIDFSARLIDRGRAELLDALQSVRYLGDLLVMARWEPSRAGEAIAEVPVMCPWNGDLTVPVLKDFYEVFNGIVDEIIKAIIDGGSRVVALSATHYQLVPSLWLARRLKEEDPGIQVILGGYLSSYETCVDLLNRHEFIDAIVFGEGEEVIIPLVHDLMHGRNPRIVLRGGRTTKLSTLPDYSETLERIREIYPSLLQYIAPCFEISRGCYWDKCDFCNFNVAYGRFRSFGAEDAIDSMEKLAADYGLSRFHLLDTGLPPSFGRHCYNRGSPDWDVFVEIMVDWQPDRLESLRNFGVQRAQVGIESLSDDHLQSMKKNATVATNLASLAHCKNAGIIPVYGLIIGRPGDQPGFYLEQAEAIEFCHHLEPPRYLSECDLRPGSQLYNDRHKWGAEIVFPESTLAMILPAHDHNCELRPSVVHLAGEDDVEMKNAIDVLREAVEEWQMSHSNMVIS